MITTWVISMIFDGSKWEDPINFDRHDKPGAGGPIKPCDMCLTVPTGKGTSMDSYEPGRNALLELLSSRIHVYRCCSPSPKYLFWSTSAALVFILPNLSRMPINVIYISVYVCIYYTYRFLKHWHGQWLSISIKSKIIRGHVVWYIFYISNQYLPMSLF